jgi:hypothetical protein
VAGLIKICENNAMALIFQVRKKKRGFLGSFQSGANNLLSGTMTSTAFWTSLGRQAAVSKGGLGVGQKIKKCFV